MDRIVVVNPVENANEERQTMGCMSGLLHRIDPTQFLGRRSTKRIPAAGNSSPEDKKVVDFTRVSPVLRPDNPRNKMVHRESPRFSFDDVVKSSEKGKVSDARLSLDSRLEVVRPRPIRAGRPDYCGNDSDDRQQNSPGIVARLMGLDELPDSASNIPAFRRQSPVSLPSSDIPRSVGKVKQIVEQKIASGNLNQKVGDSPRRSKLDKGFQSLEIFPEGRRCTEKLYSQIGRILKTKGIQDSDKELFSLKQIVEALPFSELPFSGANRHSSSQVNYVYVNGREPLKVHSPTIIANAVNCERPSRQSSQLPTRLDSVRGIRAKAGKGMPAPKTTRPTMLEPKPRKCKPIPERETSIRCRTAPIPERETSIRCPTAVLPSASSVRKIPSDGNSPKQMGSPRGVAAGGGGRRPLQTGSVRSPRNRNGDGQESLPAKITPPTCQKVTATYSAPESEGHKSSTLCTDEYGEGSVRESTEQPSPVSVLEYASGTFYNDESSDLPPLTKRSIVFREVYDSEWKEPFHLYDYNSELDSDDFPYVSEVVLISGLLQGPQGICERSDAMFMLLESRREGDETDRRRRLHRRLLFDTVMEILCRRRDQTHITTAEEYVPGKWLIRRVWSEIRLIRRIAEASMDSFEWLVNSMIERDITVTNSGNGWTSECWKTTEDTAVDIERLIFKDLIYETICELTILKSMNSHRE